MNTLSRSSLMLTAAALVAPAGFAQAPDATDTGGALEEVTVTAQRRAENVQDVPIAISAFSANELEKRNVGSPLELIQYVPNMNGNNNTGQGIGHSAVGKFRQYGSFVSRPPSTGTV